MLKGFRRFVVLRIEFCNLIMSHGKSSLEFWKYKIKIRPGRFLTAL